MVPAEMPKRDLAGLVVHDISRAELINAWNETLAGGRATVTYGYSLTVLPKLREHPEIAQIGNTFDIMLSDGRGLFWLANLAGEQIREHLSLPDAVELALQLAAREQKRVYLLGATAEVNRAAIERLEERGIEAHGRDGYLELDELDAVRTAIAALAPAIILIGITSPKKERIAQFLRSHLEACVIVPCGGMIDVIAGVTKREPRFVQRLGGTWIYRWIQEPRRLLQPVLLNGLYALVVLVPLVLVEKRLRPQRGFRLLDFLIKRG